MLFNGNQRGGGRDLALHLLKDDNERVQVHDLRGFASNDLEAAFKESYAISRATKCKQHLFSLSINPPGDKDVSDDDFENAIGRAEDRLGLTGQLRAIVFHEKKGRDGETRRHAHAVWCRINTDEMKAVQLSFTKDKLMKLSREIFIEQDWRMPPGMLNKPDRDPKNFTLEQWQQAKRAKKDPEKIIGVFQDCWSVSDTKEAFGHALAEHGYMLAKGRRGFVGVDYDGEVYAVSRWTKKRAKDVREKLGTPDKLPNVDQAHAAAAKQVADRLRQIQAEKELEERMRLERLEAARQRQAEMQRAERQRLAQEQRERRSEEFAMRKERLRKGILGLWDRINGDRKKTLQKNAMEATQSFQRDRAQRQEIQAKRQVAQEQVMTKTQSIKTEFASVQSELKEDIKTLTPEQEQRIQQHQERLARNRSQNRARNRNGPSLDR